MGEREESEDTRESSASSEVVDYSPHGAASHTNESSENGSSNLRVSLTYAIGPQCGFLQWAEPQVLIYPVGRRLAIHNVDKPADGSMYFSQENANVKGISCLDVHYEKGLLVMGENRQTEPQSCQITIVDVKSQCRPIMTFEHIKAETLVSVSFERKTASQVVCITKSGRDYSASVIEWQTRKIMATFPFHSIVSRASYNPEDSQQIVVAGLGCGGLRMYKLKDASGGAFALKEFPKISGFEGEHVMKFEWIDATRIIALTECVAMVANMETQMMTQKMIMDFYPRCAKVLPNGILFAGTAGYISFWEKADPLSSKAKKSADGPIEFTEGKTKQIGETDFITMDVLEDQAALGMNNADISLMALSSFFEPAEEGPTVPKLLEILNNGAHCDKIVGLDVAIQRQVCITCSLDKTIRVWNLLTKQCETVRRFPDAPLSIALHPFGFLAAAVFVDKIRFLTLLKGELRTSKEVGLKNGTTLRFSQGGHYLAVAHQKGQIMLIVTRNFTKSNTLKGHQNDVTAMAFSSCDKFLATGGKDGAFYVWSLTNMQRVFEHCSKKYEYTSITCNIKEPGRWFASAVTPTGGSLRVWLNNEITAELDLPQNVIFESLCMIKDNNERPALLAATNQGTLHVYPFPVTQSVYEEYGLHTEASDGDATIANISYTDNILITVGHDGSMYFATIGHLKHEFEQSDVVMINKSDVMQLEDEKAELIENNYVLNVQLQNKEMQLKARFEEKLKEASKDDQAEILDLRRRLHAVQAAQTHKDRENLTIMRTMEKNHLTGAQKLEELYEAKLEFNAEKKAELEANYNAQIEQLREEKEEERRKWEFKLKEQKKEAEDKLAAEVREKMKHKDLLAYTEHRANVMTEQEHEEHQVLMEECRRDHYDKEAEQRHQNHQLRKEYDAVLRGLEAMQREKEKILREQREAEANCKVLQTKSEELTRLCHSLKVEKQHRETTLAEKEKRIYDFKQKVSVLKKFKEVLDFKLREANDSLRPKEDQVKTLETNLSELEAEFVNQLEHQRLFDKTLEQRTKRIAILQEELKKTAAEVVNKEKYIENFRKSVLSIVGVNDSREWPALIRKLHHTYAREVKPNKQKINVIEEKNTQMMLMENKVLGLERKGGNAEHTYKLEIQRKQDENSNLIKQLNELRTQNRSLEYARRQLEYRTRELEAAQKSSALKELREKKRSLPNLSTGGSDANANHTQHTQSSGKVANSNVSPTNRGTGGTVKKGAPAATAKEEDNSNVKQLQKTIDLQAYIIEDVRLQNLALQDQLANCVAGGATERRRIETQRAVARTN